MRVFVGVSTDTLVMLASRGVVKDNSPYESIAVVEGKPVSLECFINNISMFNKEDVLLEMEVPENEVKQLRDAFTDKVHVTVVGYSEKVCNIHSRRKHTYSVLTDRLDMKWVVCYRTVTSVSGGELVNTFVLNRDMSPCWDQQVYIKGKSLYDSSENDKASSLIRFLPGKCYGGMGLYDAARYYLNKEAKDKLLESLKLGNLRDLEKFVRENGYTSWGKK